MDTSVVQTRVDKMEKMIAEIDRLKDKYSRASREVR